MRRSRHWMLFLAFSVFLSYFMYTVLFEETAPDAEKPHIIIIVADDMGWNDVSFHGADQIPTPNIDALAYNGVILNRHYVLPTCTPSRTSLMTGRYAIREGMQGTPLSNGQLGGLPLNITLMPEYMRQLGYETRLLGKWHLGYSTESHTPTRRGFDSFFGYYSGYITYFNKMSGQDINATGYDLHRDDAKLLSVAQDNHEYFTDLITDEAVKIIKKNNNKKSLFLEIAHLAAHSTGLHDLPLEVRDSAEVDKTFAYIKDKERRKYAGVVKTMDDSVGKVVEALSKAGMLQNSIILFMSDNGAPTVGFLHNSGSNYPLRGLKNTIFEGGVRGAACIFSPLIQKASRVSEDYVHVSDWLPTLYTAAGGNFSNLGEIDGFNQWRSLVYGFASSRSNILINIDEKKKMEAAIIGRYKLVKDAVNSHEDYYGESGNDDSYPKYEVEDALNSPAGRAISQLSKFTSVSTERAQHLRETATVKCQRPTAQKKCLKMCLFDIVSDPCETNNLANEYSMTSVLMLNLIKLMFRGFRKILVPQSTITIDTCAFPQYFNGSWMPWRNDDGTLIKPVPEGTCQNLTFLQNNSFILYEI